jgi:amino acid transporter
MSDPAMNKETDPKFDNEIKSEEQENPEFNLATGQNQLERGLKSRHIQFLALGMASSLPSPDNGTYIP